MNFLLKYWKKCSPLVKMGLIFALAICIHMLVVRNTVENFGNPKSCTYYYMTNCGHCKTFTPIWDSFAQSYTGPIKLRKVEMNDAKDDIEKYNIKGFPTILAIDEQGETKTFDGPRTKDGLTKFLSN